MTTKLRTAAALAFSIVFTLGAYAATPAKSPAPATHGMEAKGTVSGINEAAKTASVKDAAGKITEIVWNEATKVTGGSLRAGDSVTVRYMVKNNKNVAASIDITAAPKPTTQSAPASRKR